MEDFDHQSILVDSGSIVQCSKSRIWDLVWHPATIRGGIKKTVFFAFGQKGEGFRPIPKILIRKKLRWSKKGEGGPQFFWLKIRKEKQFFYASPKGEIWVL